MLVITTENLTQFSYYIKLMKTLFFYFLLFLTVENVHAQKLHLTTFEGISNYQGDLQDALFTFGQSHLALGIGLSYELTDKLYATAGFKYGKISGTDKKSSVNQARNLSFSSPLSTFQLGLEYDFFSLYEHKFTPYVLGGISVYHFNPTAIDTSGIKQLLQSLSTEGQGFYNGRTPYKLTQLSIPIGAGVKYAVNEKVRIGLEITFNKLFNDYLDDVSTTYVDQALLQANKGSIAVGLAYRGNEINPTASYPQGGSQRGNPKSDDWFYFGGLTVSFSIGDRYIDYAGKDQLGCPKNIF